jgi:hypothetical protein
MHIRGVECRVYYMEDCMIDGSCGTSLHCPVYRLDDEVLLWLPWTVPCMPLPRLAGRCIFKRPIRAMRLSGMGIAPEGVSRVAYSHC